MQLSPILLIIIGLVLKANPMWFNGAAAVGAFCFWAGVILLVLAVIITVVMFIAVSSDGYSGRRRRRRNRWQ